MKVTRLSSLLSLLFFALLLLAVHPTYAQHTVLFETFDNGCDPCPATGIRKPFNDAVKSTVQGNSTKIIWLNHHIGNICDPAAQSCVNSSFAGTRLSGSGNLVFYGAVDRAIFNSNGTRVSPNTTGGSTSDWSDAINQLYSNPAAATITLDSATIDKTGSPYVLTAYVSVTTLQAIPDSLILRFAVTQDNVPFIPAANNQVSCSSDPAPTPQNDVVRIITVKDTGMFVIVHGGAAAGVTKHVVWSQPIKTPSQNPSWKLADMTLIGFVEQTHGGNFQVVNAAVLKKDIDTLQSPAPTLALIDTGLNGHTFNPGTSVQISFNSTNLPGGVNAYYSLDNGTTWRFIAKSLFSKVNWTIPDSVTTQGKIKLVAVDNANLQVIQSGTFTIAFAPFLRIIHPLATDTAHAKQPFLIQWSKYAVNGVTLQYSLADQQSAFSSWTPIATHVTDTFYSWTVPDTNRMAEIQILDAEGTAQPATSNPFPIFKSSPVGVVSGSPDIRGLSITDLFPNPVGQSNSLTVRFLNDNQNPVTVQLLDLLGHIVFQNTLDAGESSLAIPTRSIAAGTYLVRISDGDRAVTKRVEVLH